MDAEEKEKLRSRLEAAYKQRLAARVDGEGGSVGSAAGRPRAGSNVSKYMFRESSAAQVVDPSAISEKERRAVRSAVSRLVEEARRSETSHLLTSTRAADYDGGRRDSLTVTVGCYMGGVMFVYVRVCMRGMCLCGVLCVLRLCIHLGVRALLRVCVHGCTNMRAA